MHEQPLSVSSYFDPDVFEVERQLFFSETSLQYAGHRALAPQANDFCVLPHTNDSRILVNDGHTFGITSNVCRHRQALMLEGRGSARHIVCPLHKWTYALSGSLIAAPRFDEKPCLPLQHLRTQDWQGLQFYGNTARLKSLNDVPEHFLQNLHLEDCVLGAMEVQHCAYNWKTFIEVYLEDYHVAPFHPGLGHFVSTGAVDWGFGENWSTQTVGFYRDLQKPGASAVYQRLSQLLREYYKTALPEVAVMWFMLYPNIMIECYPGMTIISSIYPNGINNCSNVIEYYHPKTWLASPLGAEICALSRQAYFETAEEDNLIGERMQRGRLALWRREEDDIGPYQFPLEEGMAHFHDWYRRALSLTRP